MTTQSVDHYRLRPLPFILLGCFVGAWAGAILGGGAMMVGAAVAKGSQGINDLASYPDGGMAGLIWSQVFWNSFLLPQMLLGMLFVGWPALAAVRKWQPGWFGPRLIYALGVLAGAAGSVIQLWLILVSLPAGAGLPPWNPFTAVLSAFMTGAPFGLFAAIVFRLIAVRRAPVSP